MKKTNLKILLPVLLSILVPRCMKAQFRIDAQYRPRVELRNGYQKLAAASSVPAVFVSQRIRIALSYETDKIKLKFTPQDVRTWGDEELVSSTGTGDNVSLDLFEGYAEIKLGNFAWLSVGRQQLIYDNERILAARNWNQTGISYDALLIKLNFRDWQMHFGGSWNTLTEASFDNLYPTDRIKSLTFFWLNHNFYNDLNLSLLHVASGITQTDSTNTIHFKQTTGLYSEYKNKKLTAWADGYYQYGKNQIGTDVSAFLFGADISYSIVNFVSGIGIEYLSGNKGTGTEQITDNLFDVLYGARHKYFGYLDYFRTFSSHTKGGGLTDYYFYFDYLITKSFSLRNIGHYFQLAQTNETTPDDKNLGYENDLLLKYRFSSWVTIESGYSFFLPTSTLKIIQGVQEDKFSQFFYLQLILTPTLFKQERQ